MFDKNIQVWATKKEAGFTLPLADLKKHVFISYVRIGVGCCNTICCHALKSIKLIIVVLMVTKGKLPKNVRPLLSHLSKKIEPSPCLLTVTFPE